MDKAECERLTKLYEQALEAMKQYNSCEEYLCAEIKVRKPISISQLSAFIHQLQCEINKYDCSMDDVERAEVGTEILYWCRSLGRYNCIAEDEE